MSFARLASISGLVAVAGNVGAVAALMSGVTSAYRPDEIDAWRAQAMARPELSAAAAGLFFVGVVALIPWGLACARIAISPRLARVGAGLVAVGALLNAVGVLFPLVELSPAALRWSLNLDAAFNAFFGLGLVLLGAALWPARRALAALFIVAGAATVPVALQFTSPAAARFLAVAGPLWLAAVLAASVTLWRQPRDGATSGR